MKGKFALLNAHQFTFYYKCTQFTIQKAMARGKRNTNEPHILFNNHFAWYRVYPQRNIICLGSVNFNGITKILSLRSSDWNQSPAKDQNEVIKYERL